MNDIDLTDSGKLRESGKVGAGGGGGGDGYRPLQNVVNVKWKWWGIVWEIQNIVK